MTRDEPLHAVPGGGGWREVARVGAYLSAHRGSLRPLVIVRCPVPPCPSVAEVHLVAGHRWVWGAGPKPTRAQLRDEGVNLADWPGGVAPSVRPLDRDWKISGLSVETCRKCRCTYAVDLAELDRLTEVLPAQTIELLATRRALEQDSA